MKSANSVSDIASSIIALVLTRKVLLVAIDGPGGAGKSTLAESVRATLQAGVVRSGETS